jgi:hypothetical protein
MISCPWRILRIGAFFEGKLLWRIYEYERKIRLEHIE